MASRALGVFSFFSVCSFFPSFFHLLMITWKYYECQRHTLMSAKNTSNGPTAGLETNHISSPRVFSSFSTLFFLYFLYYTNDLLTDTTNDKNKLESNTNTSELVAMGKRQGSRRIMSQVLRLSFFSIFFSLSFR